MKLYLSSYRLGKNAEILKTMVSQNKCVAIISNALDFSNDQERLMESYNREKEDMESLGFIPTPLDLRMYFGKSDALKDKLYEYGLLWVRGGNTFILRRAMQESGLDQILISYKGREDIVYAGYSAGVCVLSPSLHGLELVDDPIMIPDGYKKQTIWEGLSVIPYSVAPHYRSDHPESMDVEKTVMYFKNNNIEYRTLSDGDDIIEDY